ncbi:hypothetical protein ACNOYE_35455 [Nannocystaceae bacterium ST9]
MATAAASSLCSTTYTSSSSHDALGRVLTAISPDGSEVAYSYNERGALESIDCKHRGSSTSTPVVAEIEYDVRGRRASISYASNATTTTYEYDPLNFRLRALETTRSSDNAKLQGLHYHYDPVGNVTDIRDDAQQTVYFQNAIVEAANSYTYDALYRLVEATGREHATQGTAQRSSTALLPDSSAVPMANDPNALRRYTQSYTYDADMERQHAELLETERGASQILGSNKVIAAAAIIGTSAAGAYLLTAALGGGFLATVAVGGVDGAITGGGLSAVDGNDAEQVWEDTKTGAQWGLAFGGLGYGVSWGFGKTVSWIRSPNAMESMVAPVEVESNRRGSSSQICARRNTRRHLSAFLQGSNRVK